MVDEAAVEVDAGGGGDIARCSGQRRGAVGSVQQFEQSA